MSQPIDNTEILDQNQGENQTQNQDPKDVSELSQEELRAELKRVRQEAAARRIKNRELEDAADKWKKYEESQKTELQRLQDQLAEKDKKLSQYDLERTKVTVIQELGLDLSDADLIAGDNEASIREHAQKLKSRLGEKKETKNSPVDMLAGKRGAPVGSGSEPSIDDMIRMSARRSELFK